MSERNIAEIIRRLSQDFLEGGWPKWCVEPTNRYHYLTRVPRNFPPPPQKKKNLQTIHQFIWTVPTTWWYCSAEFVGQVGVCQIHSYHTLPDALDRSCIVSTRTSSIPLSHMCLETFPKKKKKKKKLQTIHQFFWTVPTTVLFSRICRSFGVQMIVKSVRSTVTTRCLTHSIDHT